VKDTDTLMLKARASQLKSIIYKMGSQFLIDFDFPLHLYLELSRTCNYKCPMCIRSEIPSGGHFPEKLAKKIILEAAKKGPTSYSLHLFGEPLANPKWDNIVEMIRSVNPHNTILLTTNGFFMDEACCKKIIDLRVNRIFVSMHSLDTEIYKNNTGGGDIAVVLRNIRTFLKITDARCKTRLFVRLFYGPGQAPITEDNLKELRSQGVFFEIRGYHNYAGTRNEWTTFCQTTKRWPCFHPWFTLGITVDGVATVCCTDGHLDLDIGDVFNQSIEEIWKSKAVKSIRQEHLNNRFEKWKTCGLCDTWQFHPDIFFKFQKS
jgi:MoaA/NifB/PqqE/SkfB family radical SAM enzyme